GIFTALRESACMRRGKMMSWCCLTSGDERSAIKIEGYARDDDSAKHYQNSAALHYFMRRTTISDFSFLISHSSEDFKRNQRAVRPRG
ncbi:MAG: hypothetical protein SOY71_00800, partial [Dialister sp.]|nr:hypothetical protein [Dialister sp.]